MLFSPPAASTDIRAMVAGQRTRVAGPFNKVSTFGVRFLTRRMASKVAAEVLGKPHLALPARSPTRG